MSTPDRVLVVDDDQATRELVDMVLSEEGFEVFAAPNGAVALDVVAAERPALILVDQNMPVMDGPEFIQAYHQLPHAEAAVVAMTAKQIDDAARREADAVLEKPFDIDDLVEVVKQQLH